MKETADRSKFSECLWSGIKLVRRIASSGAGYTMENWLLVVIGAAGVIGWIAKRVSERDRQVAIGEAGLQLGLTSRSVDERFRRQLFFCFPLFQRGDPEFRRITNIVRNTTNAKEMSVFDYEYTVSHQLLRSGYEFRPWALRDASTYRQTVAVFRCQTGMLLVFDLSPRKAHHKIAKIFTGGEVAFDYDSEFSKNYRVRGKQESSIRTLFRPDLLRYLGQQTGWSIEAGGEWLVIYRHSKLVSAGNLSAFLEETTRITDLFEVCSRS